MNQPKHGAILPCFSAPVHQRMLEGRHSPAFHSNDSFGFKHKPTTNISILCSVTVGCARQYVASSHRLGIHSIPFTCCSYRVGDSRKRGQSPERTPWSSPQGAQLLPLSQCTTAPGSGFPLVFHIPPRHCLLLSPAQEQRSVESRRDARCPQRRGGEFPSPPLQRPSHHTLPAVLCPMSSCISLAFTWQPLPPGPNRPFSPKGLRPMPAGTLTWRSTFVLPSDFLEIGSTWKRGANVENQACQLAPEDGEEEVGENH